MKTKPTNYKGHNNKEYKNLSFPLALETISEAGNFAGYASVFGNPDNHNDVIIKGAFTRTLIENENGKAIKFLWQHNPHEPIGFFTKIFEDAYGLYVEGKLLLDVQRAREAYALLKNNAIEGLSIGFTVRDFEYDTKTSARLLKDIDLWEVSLVTFPANEAAQITAIKSDFSNKFNFNKNNNNINKGEKMNLSKNHNPSENIGHAWEEFKKVNNRRLTEIERKGSADALTESHLYNISNALNEYKERIDNLETSINRPALGADYAENVSLETAKEHKAAFVNYVRKGVESDLFFLEKKALATTTDADGGYLVTPYMNDQLAKTIFESSPMRKLASVVNISSEAFEVIQDADEADASWAASETASVSDYDTPQVGKITIAVHELVAQPKATQKLIDDSSIDIEQWLTEKLVEVFTRKENSAFVTGDGSGKPKGILAYTAGTGSDEVEQINSGTSAVVTTDALIKLYYALKDEYASRATFLMNRATIQQVRLLKESTTGQYIWQPGLVAGTPDTLLGVPVMAASDMPVPAANSLSVAVADFARAYQIVDRTGVRILRDPYTNKPFVKFYTTKRVGGGVVNFEAIKLLKLAA
jgi:HK97 family phage major capsid protein/HK97 family phage prohead protease